MQEQCLDRAAPASVPQGLRNWLDQGRRRLVAAIVMDVPPLLAVCEFDCNRTSCNPEAWATCPRRLRAQELSDMHRND
ncbi:hypothetical protein [Amaricoccus macauensis]|uniref:hypothetical protein n=1 Tax=Amaricoccus macauensis TaxID=57001 RepID=UPI003C7BAEA3